jgi:hypothetical protein
VKRGGQEASKKDLETAAGYWKTYLQTHLVSPVKEEDDESI